MDTENRFTPDVTRPVIAKPVSPAPGAGPINPINQLAADLTGDGTLRADAVRVITANAGTLKSLVEYETDAMARCTVGPEGTADYTPEECQQRKAALVSCIAAFDVLAGTAAPVYPSQSCVKGKPLLDNP